MAQQGYPQAPPPAYGDPNQPQQYPQQPYPPGGQQPYPPPAGQQPYPPPQQQGVAPQQVVVQTVPVTTVVVSGGNCPSCGVGRIVEDFSICGIILAILCFPIGLICCFLMKDRKCSHCGRSF